MGYRTDSAQRVGALFKLFRVVASLIALAIIIDIALALLGYSSISLQASFRASSFNRIHKGMTKNQVEAIVGRPRAIEPNLAYATWTYYPTKPASSNKERGGRQASQEVFVDFGVDGRVSRTIPPMPEIEKGQIIAPGMTQEQVLRCAGKPDHMSENPYSETWVYPHWNGTEHAIEFDMKGRVAWTKESYEILSRPGTWHGRTRSHD